MKKQKKKIKEVKIKNSKERYIIKNTISTKKTIMILFV